MEGPLAAGFYATKDFQFYKSGIFTGCATSTSDDTLNHAVVIVGYDANGNYIIKNSWGT